uniref:Uncharacterized protein n=1 Tax=Mandrillus leucophaeus TaxID=9568 RepID=A0A2K5YJF1_MANLE
MNCPAPVEISYENMYFLITHNPTNATLNKFTEELKKYGVMTLVRIVDDWLNLLKTKFREEPGCSVAVHCVYEDAVQFIRQKRRGVFNSKQLLYLEKYRPKMQLHFRNTNGHCCVQ